MLKPASKRMRERERKNEREEKRGNVGRELPIDFMNEFQLQLRVEKYMQLFWTLPP